MARTAFAKTGAQWTVLRFPELLQTGEKTWGRGQGRADHLVSMAYSEIAAAGPKVICDAASDLTLQPNGACS